MSLDVSLKLTDVGNITTGRLLVGFEDENGKMHDGRIQANGKFYNVKFLEGGTAEVRRNFTGAFSWFRNMWCSRTTHAKALQANINAILSHSNSDEYRILSGSHQKLLGIVKNSKENSIEVANYGFATNRNTLRDGQIVFEMNKKLMEEGRAITLTKIDEYNNLIGICVDTIEPCSMRKMMEKISEGRLKPDMFKDYQGKFTKDDVKKWVSFLQANAAKIDIPAKLHRYMHLPEGHKSTKETGWEASFARDKTAAMRSFVLKNLHFTYRDISSEIVDLLAERLTTYVDIYAIEDKAERDQKLKAFFAKSNWLKPDEQKAFDKLVNKHGRQEAGSVLERHSLDSFGLFGRFQNILRYAFFRQTSKLGLEFFRSKGTPVLFQFSDYSGRSYHGREQKLTERDGWRDGEDSPVFRKKGGASITSSEMRRAMKMNAPNRLDGNEAGINVEAPANANDSGIIMV